MPFYVEILLLAIGLAMDATAVAGARGLAAPHVRVRDALLLASFFGGAQAIMPTLGWLLASRVGAYVERWTYVIAFVLLVGIGAKMLVEAVRGEPAASDGTFAPRVLLVLAIATSIDAFAAGFTLPALALPPLVSVAAIGWVTFACSLAGVYAGRRFGALMGRRLDALGGVVLIGLGVKALFG